MTFGSIISRITNPVLIFFLFLFIFIPIGIMRNFFKKKSTKIDSYWIEDNDKKYDFNDQF